MCLLSSAAEISSIFLHSSFIFKDLSSILHLVQFLSGIFVFVFQHKFFNRANRSKPSLGHFSKRTAFCATAYGWRSLQYVYSSSVNHHQWNFVVRFADWTNDSFLRWNFVVRAPGWLRAESERILFTMIFVDKSQYLWNTPGFATEFRTRQGLKGVGVGAFIKKYH